MHHTNFPSLQRGQASSNLSRSFHWCSRRIRVLGTRCAATRNSIFARYNQKKSILILHFRRMIFCCSFLQGSKSGVWQVWQCNLEPCYRERSCLHGHRQGMEYEAIFFQRSHGILGRDIWITLRRNTNMICNTYEYNYIFKFLLELFLIWALTNSNRIESHSPLMRDE